MRIIAGSVGGRRIVAPETHATRPVTDRVREAVFSSIAAYVEDADVADLYAGSGSFGLEALSRGARSAVFVENARLALRALDTNIKALGIGGEVIRSDVRTFLASADRIFGIVFIDPPWPMSTDDLESDFAMLDSMLSDGALVIASRRHTDHEPEAPENWRVAANKRYGDTRILRYEKENREI